MTTVNLSKWPPEVTLTLSCLPSSLSRVSDPYPVAHWRLFRKSDPALTQLRQWLPWGESLKNPPCATPGRKPHHLLLTSSFFFRPNCQPTASALLQIPTVLSLSQKPEFLRSLFFFLKVTVSARPSSPSPSAPTPTCYSEEILCLGEHGTPAVCFPPSPPIALPLSGITSLFPLLAFRCLLLLIYLSVHKREGTLVLRSHQLPVPQCLLVKTGPSWHIIKGQFKCRLCCFSQRAD